MRAAQAQVGGEIVVEALERERAVVSASERGGPVGDAPVAVEPALDLADDRRPAGDRVEKRGEGRRRLARAHDPDSRDLGRAEARERARGVGQTIEGFVMENNRFAVGAELDVAFDGEAAVNRRLRRPERILDDAPRVVVQAAMSDRPLDEPGGSVDRRQSAISNTASIAASALSGRCDAPLVMRAWRPLSPNSSAIRLEAPFIACGRASKLDSTLKNPPSRTTCLTQSRSPSAACACARTLMTQSRAASRAASISELGASLP